MASDSNPGDKGLAGTWRRRPAGSAIVIGDFTSVTFMPYLTGALRTAGWDVLELDLNRYFGTSGNNYLDHLMWKLAPHSRAEKMAAALVAQVNDQGGDVVIFPKAIGATPALIERLEQAGCRSVCWYPDVSFDHRIVDQAALSRFHLFITTKAFQMPWLADMRPALGNVLVEHGYCDGPHRRIDPPLNDDEKLFDLAFVGNHSAYKEDWLRQIMERDPGLTLAVAGARWSGCDWMNTPNIWRADGPMIGDAMARLFNHSRIALALHHGPDGNRFGWQDDVSARTFEIPACGTFMLHIDNAHVRTLFDVPGDIDTFATPEEASDKIRHYLDHSEQREAMAARAHQRAVPAYGYAARAGEVVGHLNALIQGGRP